MARLVLLILLGLILSYYFPDSRRVLVEKSKPLWVPVMTWNTKEEMHQIARDVVSQEQMTGQLPDRRNWLGWLDYRYSMEESKTDAWGSVYELKVWQDSVGILSYGPDRERGTDDDIIVAERRERNRREP